MKQHVATDDPIPGTVLVNGRSFVYIEGKASQHFEQLFDSLQEFVQEQSKKGSAPKSGALLSEDFCLVTADERFFFGLSFRGDLAVWTSILENYAVSKSLHLAEITQDELRVDDGQLYPLARCQKYTVQLP